MSRRSPWNRLLWAVAFVALACAGRALEAQTEAPAAGDQSGAMPAAQAAVALPDASQTVGLADEGVVAAYPALRELAEGNRQLAGRLADTLAPKLERATRHLQQIGSIAADLEADLTRLGEKVSKARMSKALSLLLRRKLAGLPDVRRLESEIEARQAETSDTQLALFELDDERSAWADAEAAAGGLSAEEALRVESSLRALVLTRQELLQGLSSGYESYFDALIELDTRERDLIRLAGQYAAFVDKRILWFRSSPPLLPSVAPDLLKTLAMLLAPANWLSVPKALGTDLWVRLPLYALGAVVFLALLCLRPRAKAALLRTGEIAAHVAADSPLHTLTALAYTAVIALPWPLLVGLAGWQLAQSPGAEDFARALGVGLEAAALALLTLGLLRALCVKGGVAEQHFGWPARAVTAFRVYLALMMPVFVPAVFVVAMFEWWGVEAYRDSLGRIAFVVGQVALAIFVARVLRRRGGVLQEFLESRIGGWLNPLRLIWYGAAVLVPLVLAGGAAAGYYYAALTLTWRAVITAWLLLGLLLGYEVMLRWVFVVQRRLAHEQAVRKREAELAEATRSGTEVPPAPPEEPEMSIHCISAQSRELLGSFLVFATAVVLWFVWSGIVPALSIVGDITLERGIPITVGGVGLALFVLLVTAFAAKNVPGLLEIAALRYLPLDPSLRFALTRICRYLITLAGVVVAAGAIGVRWEHVQWLAAAATVGLGFGLQEIFANFVSGIIILFERPMRVGDTVTVGETTGTVTRIRIRATTITDWDRKELVVPNKEFITGRLVNWTLSDRILRVIIPVGIAYGSDTELAVKLLIETARRNENVLTDPPPNVMFQDFGDSSLEFELRAYVTGIDVYHRTRHQLHMAVDRAFREAGIEIAFPQRDVHVRSISAALPVDLLKEQE